MPSRNSIKTYLGDAYYHIYNRGVDKRIIFADSNDYSYFLSLLKRHLSNQEAVDKLGRPYRHLLKEVELLAYCLMPNHFHLLVYNQTPSGIEQLMRSISTAYSIYFNKKYDRSGTLFQGVYRAAEIDQDEYLLHISRYIHRNPVDYESYSYSSFSNYIGARQQEWLKPQKMLSLFESVSEYQSFVADYTHLPKDDKKNLEQFYAA